MFEKMEQAALENALKKRQLEEVDPGLLDEPLRFCLMIPVQKLKTDSQPLS